MHSSTSSQPERYTGKRSRMARTCSRPSSGCLSLCCLRVCIRGGSSSRCGEGGRRWVLLDLRQVRVDARQPQLRQKHLQKSQTASSCQLPMTRHSDSKHIANGIWSPLTPWHGGQDVRRRQQQAGCRHSHSPGCWHSSTRSPPARGN